MRLSRRSVLSHGAAGLGLSLLARAAWANATLDLGGGARIDTLSDGHLVLPGAFIFGPMPADRIAPILARYEISPDRLEPPCNVTLLRSRDRVILFDIGAGPNFMASAGQLPQALAALGLSPEDVTDVVFTHGHPDHLWGVLDDFDELSIPDAQYHMGAVEHGFWSDPATLDALEEGAKPFAVGARSRLERIADRVRLFDDGATVLPGVTARATHGHTPGHMSFVIEGTEGTAMVVGDAIANHHVAFEAPALPSGSDQDRQMAAKTRTDLLQELSDSDMPMIGFHLPAGGIGRVRKAGEAFRFEVAR